MQLLYSEDLQWVFMQFILIHWICIGLALSTEMRDLFASSKLWVKLSSLQEELKIACFVRDSHYCVWKKRTYFSSNWFHALCLLKVHGYQTYIWIQCILVFSYESSIEFINVPSVSVVWSIFIKLKADGTKVVFKISPSAGFTADWQREVCLQFPCSSEDEEEVTLFYRK